MQIVILAAGQGTRLGEASGQLPKSLVQMGERPYFSYQLEVLTSLCDAQIVVVGGYGISCMAEFLKLQNHSQVRLVENIQFTKGNLLSLLAARDLLTEDFFVFNADHCYSRETYSKILSLAGADDFHVCCDADRSLTADDMKVYLDAEGHFLSMSKTLTEFQLGYVGVSYIPKRMKTKYFEISLQLLKQQGDQIHVESVINECVRQGYRINICDISGSWWTEIDTPADLTQAKLTFQRAGLLS